MTIIMMILMMMINWPSQVRCHSRIVLPGRQFHYHSLVSHHRSSEVCYVDNSPSSRQMKFEVRLSNIETILLTAGHCVQANKIIFDWLAVSALFPHTPTNPPDNLIFNPEPGLLTKLSNSIAYIAISTILQPWERTKNTQSQPALNNAA